MEESEQYGNKARADTIALVVMDEKKEKMSILSINRDTMTDIRRYTMNGNDKGLYETHLGYAYSYGDGGEVVKKSLRGSISSYGRDSCEPLCGDKPGFYVLYQ